MKRFRNTVSKVIYYMVKLPVTEDITVLQNSIVTVHNDGSGYQRKVRGMPGWISQ